MVAGDIVVAGHAALYAAGLCAALLAVLRTAGRGPGWRFVPVVFTTAFFVLLTQLPFPDPATLVCPAPLTEPQWQPFRFLETYRTLIRLDADPSAFLMNRTLATTALNFLLCVAIGLSLVRHVTDLRLVLLFSAALTLGAEMTQLTGFWWLYPCAYRHFDVDDLVMNVGGVLAGALAGRARSRRT